MELQKFITESLKQICLGIKQAQEEIEKEIRNCPIAPASVDKEKAYDKDKPEKICFDIAVTISNDNKLNAVGGIDIKFAKGNAGKETSEKKENVHRISFNIPFYPQFLTIPYHDLKDNK